MLLFQSISCFMAWNHCHVNVRYPIFKVQGFKRESHGIGRQIPLVCPEELHLAIYTTQHDQRKVKVGEWPTSYIIYHNIM